MGSVNIVFAGIVCAGLITVIILLIVYHRKDTRDLRDRLMSRDFHDFSVGKAIQAARPIIQSDAEEAERALGVTQEDKELSDRLPVS